MTLLFLRHALAEDRLDGMDHPERRLTQAGLRQSRTMGIFARRNALDVHAILSSPVRRARETAQHFASQLKAPPPVETVPWLQIHAEIETATAEIVALGRENRNTVLVGHEPDFSLVIGAILRMGSAGIKIRKASLTCLACVDPHTDAFQLKWSITPDLLRARSSTG